MSIWTLAKIALDLTLSVDDRADLIQLVFAEITDLCVRVDRRFVEDRRRARLAHAVNVRQTNLCPFVGR